MFGETWEECEALLVKGEMSLRDYGARLLSDLLNAARPLATARDLCRDDPTPDAEELRDAALDSFLQAAEDTALRARLALVVGLGACDADYFADNASVEWPEQLEQFGGAIVDEWRRHAEDVAARGIAQRPDLWKKLA